MTAKSDFERLIKIDDCKYLDEGISSCFLGQVFRVYEGRNAWHATWVESAYHENEFFSVGHEAREWIERRRKQGSSWSIEGIPAIVAVGVYKAVLIVEMNSTNPFNGWHIPNHGAMTLRWLLNSFSRPNTFHMYFLCGSAFALPAVLPIRLCVSKSQGVDYNFGWSKVPKELDLMHASEVIRLMTLRLQEA